MIFLTIGSHEPFDRLIRAVDDWCEVEGCGGDVFGQITDKAAYTPQNFEWVTTLDPIEYQKHIESAEFIISHAGMGSIISSLSQAKPIVVLPRRGHFGETRNDHQYDTIKGLGARPGLFPALSEEELPKVLNAMREQGAKGNIIPIDDFAAPELSGFLRDFIFS